MSEERQLANNSDPWWGEHVHRYSEVVGYLAPTDSVLDLACGTGFGSDIIAQHTSGLVIGSDIAADAIKQCNDLWKRDNLRFEVLDGTALPYSDKSFDKVVSFETIEHTTLYKKMMNEFSRVLKDEGVAFISTPNIRVNSPDGKILNPFHTQEFTYDELRIALESNFRMVNIFGQKYSRYDNGNVNKSGKFIDAFFNIIGIRKMPYSIKTGISGFFTGKPFYPTVEDFSIVSEKEDVLLCKTFFCICTK
jgi:ubiquinone/menaquinone biosynthesis C-methylase UbiE